MPENPQQLHNAIAERIQQQGPIPVAEYMQMALDSYYSSGNPFGADGDFVTAPEISQMFGEMIGAWLVDMWLQMGRPENIMLVELGPGRGTLAADIMRTISAWPDFKSALKLHLVETSARLRDIQAAALKNYHVEWHSCFSDVPEGVCFVIANEFFDALPVRQFERMDGEWRERCVGYDREKDIFYYTHAKYPSVLTNEVAMNAPDGSIFEINPASGAIIGEISRRIARQGGAALIIDYGHKESGLGDTLQAVSKHQYSNPLEDPGKKDITAHVDFAMFKAVAGQAVNVTGPVTQGQFLIALGIEARAQKLCENATSKQCQGIMADLCRLVAPQEMGRLFKVMALTGKKDIIEPAGFGIHNDEISDD